MVRVLARQQLTLLRTGLEERTLKIPLKLKFSKEKIVSEAVTGTE